MSEPIILLDVWEADANIDHKTLIDNDVAGLIVRLNDMDGGHHLDAHFPDLWKAAQDYFTQAIYFVYNPWVDGKANFEWLAKNLPPKYVNRLHIDTEVKYPGYTPKAYADQCDIFHGLVQQNWPDTTYTGEWFLSYLAHWPKMDYWWAFYPDELHPPVLTSISWEGFRAKMAAFGYRPEAVGKAPGPVGLWQMTAERYTLPGMNGRYLDMNWFNGDLPALKAHMGGSSVSQPSTGEITLTTTSPFAGRALGPMLYSNMTAVDDTKLAAEADFGVVVAGFGQNEEALCTDNIGHFGKANKPCLLLLSVDPSLYTGFGNLDTSHWFPVENDPHIKVLKKMIVYPDGISRRAVHGIVLDFRSCVDGQNKPIPGGWIGAVGKHLIDIVWKEFGLKVYALFDKDILTAYPDAKQDPQVWISSLDSVSMQVPAAGLVDGLPDANSKPSPINTSGKWDLWWAFNKKLDAVNVTTPMFMSVLDPAGFAKSLNFATLPVDPPVVEPPADPVPPVQTPEDPTLAELAAEVATLETKEAADEAKIADLENKLESAGKALE